MDQILKHKIGQMIIADSRLLMLMLRQDGLWKISRWAILPFSGEIM